MAGVTPNQSAIQTALRTFLIGVLPDNTPVVAGQINRVAEPLTGDFAVFWPISRNRLAWNIDSYVDAVFTGSIAGNTLDITAVNPQYNGQIAVGLYIFGVGITDGTKVTGFGTGVGGIGTYTVSGAPQTVASETIAAGSAGLLQKTEVVFQVDVHGNASSDNSQIIATAFFDDIAQRYFQPETTGVAPLYCSDPRQMVFWNGESQAEDRYIIDVHLQVNATVLFSQQFAQAVSVQVISVEAEYPVA